MKTAKSMVMKPLFRMRVEQDKTKYNRKKVKYEEE